MTISTTPTSAPTLAKEVRRRDLSTVAWAEVGAWAKVDGLSLVIGLPAIIPGTQAEISTDGVTTK